MNAATHDRIIALIDDTLEDPPVCDKTRCEPRASAVEETIVVCSWCQVRLQPRFDKTGKWVGYTKT